MSGWQLLKTRDFSLLFWGQMTSQIGDSLNRVALLWFVYQLTGSAMKMVMIGLLQTIPPLVLSPLIGVYLDRANKKTVMVWVDIARSVLVLLIPLLYAFDQLTLERLYAAVFLLAVVSTMFGPALSASVPQLVSRDQLTAANALLQTTTNTGLLIGPLISGVGIALIGSQNVLYVDAVTFFISALCLIFMRMRPLETTGRENVRTTWTQELLAGIRFVYLEQTVLVLMVAAALYSLAASAFAFMLPVFAEQNLSAGALEVGALWSALGAGMLATSTWLASLAQGDLHRTVHADFPLDGRRRLGNVRTKHVDGAARRWSLDPHHRRQHRPVHANRLGSVAGGHACATARPRLHNIQHRIHGFRDGRHGGVRMGRRYDGASRELARDRFRAPLHRLPRRIILPALPPSSQRRSRREAGGLTRHNRHPDCGSDRASDGRWSPSQLRPLSDEGRQSPRDGRRPAS